MCSTREPNPREFQYRPAGSAAPANNEDLFADRAWRRPAFGAFILHSPQGFAARLQTDSSRVVILPRLLWSAALHPIVKGTLPFLARVVLASLIFLAQLAVADTDDALRYHVEIDAPSSVKSAVERSLDLVRWQNYGGLNPG